MQIIYHDKIILMNLVSFSTHLINLFSKSFQCQIPTHWNLSIFIDRLILFHNWVQNCWLKSWSFSCDWNIEVFAHLKLRVKTEIHEFRIFKIFLASDDYLIKFESRIQFLLILNESPWESVEIKYKIKDW